jgi:hypothetical protein
LGGFSEQAINKVALRVSAGRGCGWGFREGRIGDATHKKRWETYNAF